MKSPGLALIPILLPVLVLVPMLLLHHPLARIQASPPSPGPPAASVPPEPPAYTTATPTADGIGKFFLGREIAKVMGHPGIGWLERTEREQEEAPSRAIALLQLAPDTVIADIGAGSGYYSFRLARLIPQGKVFAVDIQQEMLDHLHQEAKRRQLGNVVPHLGEVDDIRMRAGTLDAVLLVDSYHEFSHPVEMLRSIHRALKPRGRAYLVEFRAEDPGVPIKPLHKMTEKQAVREWESLGFSYLGNRTSLPWQHLLVFEKP